MTTNFTKKATNVLEEKNKWLFFFFFLDWSIDGGQVEENEGCGAGSETKSCF